MTNEQVMELSRVLTDIKYELGERLTSNVKRLMDFESGGFSGDSLEID